jgi:adenine-specific DNA-methyltransferase
VYSRTYPAIYRFQQQFRQALIDRYDQGHYFWELRACTYWEEFEKPKVISTKVSIRPTFAYDKRGSYLGNTAYFFPVDSGGLYLLSLLNSNVFQAYAKRVFVEKQNGWYEVQPDGLESFPVPTVGPDRQCCCERMVDCLLWMSRHFGGQEGAKTARDELMLNYFEQILNGLVYEVYFSDDLHAHGLRLFELVIQAHLPALESIPEAQRPSHLRELFETLYSNNHPLRGALHTLLSLETIRIIEGEQ